MTKTIVALYSDPEREHIACRDNRGMFIVYKRMDKHPGIIYYEKDLQKPIELIGEPPANWDQPMTAEEIFAAMPIPKTQLDHIKKEDLGW
jgi:hypothetical protein